MGTINLKSEKFTRESFSVTMRNFVLIFLVTILLVFILLFIIGIELKIFSGLVILFLLYILVSYYVQSKTTMKTNEVVIKNFLFAGSLKNNPEYFSYESIFYLIRNFFIPGKFILRTFFNLMVLVKEKYSKP